MYKIDLVDVYMSVCIFPEDLLRINFVLPLNPLDTITLIGFQPPLTMDYVNSDPYFFCTSEIVAELSNQS